MERLQQFAAPRHVGIRALLVVAGLAAARMMFQLSMQLSGSDAIKRHHLETSSFILAAILIVLAFLTLRATSVPVFTNERTKHIWMVLCVFSGAALALFWPILRIGLFSDDFVLLPSARAGTWFVRDWTFIRPLPLALWWAASAVSGPAADISLHLINVTLHGINATLIVAVASALGIAWPAAVVGGMLFLTFPASVEPVVWVSGVFDVATTTALLAAVFLALRAERTRGTLTMLGICVIAALMCKETAVVAPALIGIALVIAHGPRAAIAHPALWLAAAIVGIYLGLRFTLYPQPIDYPPLTGYAAKELLSRPIGALAMPFSAEFVELHPFLATLVVLAAPLLMFGHALTWTAGRASSLPALALVGWVFAAVGPVFTVLYISPELEASRYLYLASAGWTLMFALLLSRANRLRPVGYAAAALLVVVFALALRTHLTPWRAAAPVRDAALTSALRLGAECASFSVTGLPDSLRGAFIFRNGFQEALRAAGSTATVAADATCTLDLSDLPQRSSDDRP